MFFNPPPKTNLQRQREFQKRHPGYDAGRKARERASASRNREKSKAEWLALTQAHKAEELPVSPLAPPAAEPMLTLRGRVEDPTLASLKSLAAAFAEVMARAPSPTR